MTEQEIIESLEKCIEDFKDGDLYGVADELERIASDIYEYGQSLEEETE